MKLNRKLSPGLARADDSDPRDGQGAEIIDLATRNVLPQVAQRKPRSDAMGLAAGIGIVAALVLRIVFALLVTQLMQIVGLIFAGGLLLLWVSWKMYRELHPKGAGEAGSPEIEGDERSGRPGDGHEHGDRRRRRSDGYGDRDLRGTDLRLSLRLDEAP